MEIVECILSQMSFNDRLNFRQTSSHFRLVLDHFVEHRVRRMFSQSTNSQQLNESTTSTTFLEQFCRLIYETTVFLHRISFPQFMSIFVSQKDLISCRALHWSIVAKISNAKAIGDVNEVFEKMMLKYLQVVQAGCGTQRNKFKFLLILTILHLLKVSG